MIDQPALTPRFAIVLAAYNGMRFITEQIESILNQRNVDLQIFVSVDVSSDGTHAHVVEWAVREPRLTVLPYGERFGGAGPNFYRLLRDVSLDGYDYLSFADQDDCWDQDKLSRAHSVMRERRADGYSSNFTAFWPSGRTRFVNKARPQRAWDFLFESAGPGCTYVVTRRLAVSLQAIAASGDKRLELIDYHDWLVYAYARFHQHCWVIDSWSSMQYRQHENNQIGVNSGWRSFALRARKILQGYGFQQSLLIAGVIRATTLPIIRRGLLDGRVGYLRTALQATECRRKRADQVLFFISCVLLAVINPASSAAS